MLAAIDAGLLRHGLIFFLILLCSLSIHEWAHAWTANRLGDPTPQMQGRLTLNPQAHIDLMGTIIFPLICIFMIPGGLLFGWARPVSINPSYFRHAGRDSALVAFAGPLSNLCLALLASIGGSLLFGVQPRTVEIFAPIVLLNVILAVFNLLPVPPLDGGQLLRYFTGMREETYLRFSAWGGLILLAIILLGPLRQILSILIGLVLQPFMMIYPELGLALMGG